MRELQPPAIEGPRLAWYQGLGFKLGLLFVLFTIIFLAGTVVAGRYFVRAPLIDASLRHQLEGTRRIAVQLLAVAHQVQLLASTGAAIAAVDLQAAGQLLPRLADGAGIQTAGFGLWPEPTDAKAPERHSVYWMRGEDGALQARYDYNDPKIVPYWREKWYTPARYGGPERCYWSPAYVQPLSQRQVVTCAVPIRTTHGFRGVVTVDLAMDTLAAQLNGEAGLTTGYALLTDANARVLAGSATAAALVQGKTAARNLAELAQRHPELNDLALDMHERARQRLGAPDNAQARTLQNATRDMTLPESEAALATLAIDEKGPASEGRSLVLAGDPVLRRSSIATLVELGNTGWQLVRIVPAREGFAGADLLFGQTVLVIGAAATLTLWLIYLILRSVVLSPLKRMLRKFDQSSGIDDVLGMSLNASARNEIGLIAHWHNERIRQLGEMMEKSIALNSHLVVEAGARREAQAALANIRERAALTLQAISDAVITTDEQGNVDEMNAAAEDLTGYPLRDARGHSFGAVFVAREHGDQGAPLPNLAQLAIERGTRLEYPNGLTLSGFGGSRRSVTLTITPVRARQNKIIGAVAVFRLRTVDSGVEILQAEQRRLADPLTGLPTRADCDRHLRQLMDSAKLTQHRHAVALLDLDNFRRVVDSGGQPAADRVLAQVAELLVSKTAGAGQVYRLLADEFVIVLENFDADRARVFADALRGALGSTRMYWESRYFSVATSVGIAEFGADIDSPGEVLRRADDACAAAKRAGRNTVKVFDPAMNRTGEALDDEIWVRRIRAGLDHNRFHLTTQYIEPLQTHLAEGHPFELFVALEDEEGFWAAPSAFLPAAERHHLVPGIDRWVLQHALEHLSRNPTVVERIAFASINISGATLRDATTLELISRLLQKSPQLLPHRLCFEVHEDAILDSPHPAKAFFEAVRGLGCRLAIDHFHGHRSAELAVLRQLPTDFVKIDTQEFKSISGDPIDQLVAETTIRLARTLRRRVIAANIDNPRTLDIWRRLGADYFQGFTIAKPSPVIFMPPGAEKTG